METSQLSSVPTFKVERFYINDEEGSRDMLRVVCPRASCGGEFWVGGGWPVRARGPRPDAGTRACPWCFRVAWVPGKKPGEPPPRRFIAKVRKGKRADLKAKARSGSGR